MSTKKTVGVLCNNALKIWIIVTSNMYDYYNPLTLKVLLILSDCSQTIYYMVLLVFIHASTRFPLRESLTSRLLLGINLGCIACFWFFQWVSNMLDLSVFYLNFGRPHNPELVKFIVHLDNFSRVFATQACFLSFEQLYRVWGSVFSKESSEQEALMPKLTPLERRRTSGIMNYMYDSESLRTVEDTDVIVGHASQSTEKQRKTYIYGDYKIEDEYVGTALSPERKMLVHSICAAFQLARLIVGLLLSMNFSVNASIGALSVELVNHSIALGASIVLLYMCSKNPRKIKTGQYNLYDILLNAYAFGPFIFYIGGVICNAYFFFIPNHSDKFQHCFEELGVSINITGNI